MFMNGPFTLQYVKTKIESKENRKTSNLPSAIKRQPQNDLKILCKFQVFPMLCASKFPVH